MKFIVFSILFPVFSLGANVSSEAEVVKQVVTACSLMTEFEQVVRNCIEERNGQNCGIGLGFNKGVIVSGEVEEIWKAFVTDFLTSCDEEDLLQCALKKATSAMEQHCTSSN